MNTSWMKIKKCLIIHKLIYAKRNWWSLLYRFSEWNWQNIYNQSYFIQSTKKTNTYTCVVKGNSCNSVDFWTHSIFVFRIVSGPAIKKESMTPNTTRGTRRAKLLTEWRLIIWKQSLEKSYEINIDSSNSEWEIKWRRCFHSKNSSDKFRQAIWFQKVTIPTLAKISNELQQSVRNWEWYDLFLGKLLFHKNNSMADVLQLEIRKIYPAMHAMTMPKLLCIMTPSKTEIMEQRWFASSFPTSDNPFPLSPTA